MLHVLRFHTYMQFQVLPPFEQVVLEIAFVDTFRILLHNVRHLHNNYKACPSFPSWDILRYYVYSWSCWFQITLDLNQQNDFVLIVVHFQAKYGICTKVISLWVSSFNFGRFCFLNPNDVWPSRKMIVDLFRRFESNAVH